MKKGYFENKALIALLSIIFITAFFVSMGIFLMFVEDPSELKIVDSYTPSKDYDIINDYGNKGFEKDGEYLLTYKCEVLMDVEDNLFFVTKTEYYYFEFDNYELYKQTKDRAEKRGLKNCEVLK